ncbi:hypothetical protein SAMN05216249_10862 [Acetitomaculum ruminis DSM 5522]|uniref:TIGR00299 family protein n=1 Tax=Acetitomaculum ruminis DSM 5522 TaxID=1120918 RepID=A0A1I0Y0W5_9FIRM|nr:LarC family nickel insertion protein [Acetitomaculum ruminis]SFB06814.1 hypothetical protein SAMN05216249_10862 [Acetitomaculum ruminis DSM 5522]
MEKILYFECFSGISGDMSVAAMLDLGADCKALKKALDSLGDRGFQVKISRIKKSGLDVCDFLVELENEYQNMDHDMEYLHGHEHIHTHQGEHAHNHHHVGIKEINELLDKVDMTENARKLSKKIFDILAVAESKAHGISKEEVHFHEVGAIDSIVDIVAFSVCFDSLNIKEVCVPVLYEGRGSIRCQHGIIPVPVPAVLNISQREGLKLHITDVEGELVTPTGAAIIAAIKTRDKLPEKFLVKKAGLGAGKRKYEVPGILRAMIIEEK